MKITKLCQANCPIIPGRYNQSNVIYQADVHADNKIMRYSHNFFIEDSTHVMIKVMLPIICLRNHNSKITGASPVLCQVPCYVTFHVMKCNISC